jgi:hypothetical protein
MSFRAAFSRTTDASKDLYTKAMKKLLAHIDANVKQFLQMLRKVSWDDSTDEEVVREMKTRADAIMTQFFWQQMNDYRWRLSLDYRVDNPGCAPSTESKCKHFTFDCDDPTCDITDGIRQLGEVERIIARNSQQYARLFAPFLSAADRKAYPDYFSDKDLVPKSYYPKGRRFWSTKTHNLSRFVDEKWDAIINMYVQRV